MTTFSAVMGDPYASREGTVKKMLAKIGRDTSDLTLSAGTVTAAATISDDPDIRMAWDALVEVTAEVLSQFLLFNTVRYAARSFDGTDHSIAPDGSGYYLVPANPDTTATESTSYAETTGAIANTIVSVKVLSQPEGMALVYRGDPITAPRLFDNNSKSYGSFAGYGNVELEVTYSMMWEYIPFVFRNYIFTRAARRFVASAVGAEAPAVQQLRDDEFAALGRAQAYDLEQSPVNMRDGAVAEIDDRGPW